MIRYIEILSSHPSPNSEKNDFHKKPEKRIREIQLLKVLVNFQKKCGRGEMA